MISRRLLMIFVASVDLFAAMLIIHLRQPPQDWEAWMAISDPTKPAAVSSLEPVQIWIRPGQIGCWPDTRTPLTLETICRQLETTARKNPGRLEIRLLCDPGLAVEELGGVAVRLAAYAEDVSVAPLPENAREELMNAISR